MSMIFGGSTRAGWPPNVGPVTEVQSFTYEDALTVTDILAALKKYITQTLVPYLQEVVGELNENNAEMIAEITAKLAEQTADVVALLAAQDAENDAKISALTQYVNEQVQLIINDAIEVQDPVVAGIVADTDSATRTALDDIYIGADQGETIAVAAVNSELAGTTVLTQNMTPAQRADIATGTPTIDMTSTVQAAITALGKRGGGRLIIPGGTYLISGTLILLTNVAIEAYGAHFTGTATNMFETGYLDTGVAVSNIPDFATDQGNGIASHHTVNASIEGLKVTTTGTAFRLSWFVRGSHLSDCDIKGDVLSIRSTCSWGQSYHRNTFRSTVHLSHYMDWCVLENNSWEKCANIGLLIGSGGSWSMRIIGNGFHWTDTGEGTAIKIEGGVRNLVIESNHFESNKRHIYGLSQTMRNVRVQNNHLAATPFNRDVAKLKAVEFLDLKNSVIGPNDFELGGVTDDEGIESKYTINTTATFLNRVIIEDVGTTIATLAKSAIVGTNIVDVLKADNNPTNTQAQITPYAGTSGKTFEKYDAKYSYAANLLPGCVVTRTGSTHVIDTFIDCDTVGVSQPCYFYLRPGGATNTYRVAGRIAGRFGDPVFDVRQNYGSGVAGPNVTFSNNAGKLRITLTGLDDPSNITGWVKAI